MKVTLTLKFDHEERPAIRESWLHFPPKFFAPHEEQAQHNHSQSLKRLNERGGLSAVEAMLILQGKPLPRIGEWADELNALQFVLEAFDAWKKQEHG